MAVCLDSEGNSILLHQLKPKAKSMTPGIAILVLRRRDGDCCSADRRKRDESGAGERRGQSRQPRAPSRTAQGARWAFRACVRELEPYQRSGADLLRARDRDPARGPAHDLPVVPCQYSGSISINGTVYEFSINAGASGVIRGTTAATSRAIRLQSRVQRTIPDQSRGGVPVALRRRVYSCSTAGHWRPVPSDCTQY